MSSAKDLRVQPISSQDARRVIRRLHYSGKVVPNSQLHLGVFWEGKCEGALQFGPSLVKSNTIGLVNNTGWNEYIELNRMAFSDKLPRFSESRAIGYSLRLLKKRYPQLKWVLSFSDACQCGDGTIYRASGFKLLAIKPNTSLRINPSDGTPMHAITAHHRGLRPEWQHWKPIAGFQLKYIYFLDKQVEKDLTVPILPFSAIAEAGAGMYKGELRMKQAMAGTTSTAAVQLRPMRSISGVSND